MKKILSILIIFGIFALYFSCSSEDITRETVIIEDELDPNDPDPTDPDDPGAKEKDTLKSEGPGGDRPHGRPPLKVVK